MLGYNVSLVEGTTRMWERIATAVQTRIVLLKDTNLKKNLCAVKYFMVNSRIMYIHFSLQRLKLMTVST